jgi:oligopeptide/dipeptide ABC transporter ATP-binding protein
MRSARVWRRTAKAEPMSPSGPAPAPAPPKPPALDVRGLRVRFEPADRRRPTVLVVDGLDLAVERGHIVALTGESGSGKSVTLLALAGLLPSSAFVEGTVHLDGRSLLDLPEAERARVRGRGMGLVFQDPGGSLNPVLSIGRQVDEVLAVHRGLRGRAVRAETEALLARCGFGDPRRQAEAFPHQLSGGLKQRAAIAAALAAGPSIILADEPTTALDATVQAQILDLLVDLVDHADVALLLVTHDLAVAAAVADRIDVAYAGRIVESRPAERLMARPRHPYTLALREASLPFAAPAAGTSGRLPELPGRMPSAGGVGCSFAPRCPLVVERCRLEDPPLTTDVDGAVACWRAGEASA